MQNQEILKHIAKTIELSLSSENEDIRKAETQIRNYENQPGFVLYLMKLVGHKNVKDQYVLTQTAVLLKNFIKKNWEPVIRQSSIPNDHKNMIKENIVKLLLSLPQSPVQKVVCEIINQIVYYDFPKKWKNLGKDLCQQFLNPNLEKVFGVLLCFSSICEKYQGKILDRDLANEMNELIDISGKELLKFFQAILKINPKNLKDKMLKTYLNCILFMTQIFYSLNNVDVHEFFQNNVQYFMKGFNFLIVNLNIPSEQDLTNEIKTQISKISNLYMEKYQDEFKPFCKLFVQTILTMLRNMNKKIFEEEYNPLVSAAFKFLTTVSTGTEYQIFRNNSQLIFNIVDQIVIPNIKISQVDADYFKEEPLQYVRRDIQGSDSFTRRRASVELIKGLCKYNYDTLKSFIFKKIQFLLQQHKKNGDNWMAKDIAIHLYIAVSVKGKTRQHGAMELNKDANVVPFFKSYILGELKRTDVNKNPILIADSIKFVTLYRSILPKDSFKIIFPLLIKLLKCEIQVIHTYAAWSIERVLSVFELNTSKKRFTASDILPFAKDMLSSLFGVLKFKKSKENEYVMKGIMRITTILKGEMKQIMRVYLNIQTENLKYVSNNPRNPQFNHYLFESFATVIKFNPSFVEDFEKALFPTFKVIMDKDIPEFTPYIFQIFSQLLELRAVPIPNHYVMMFKALLEPKFWENTGNIPGIVGLIGSYSLKSPEMVLTNVIRILSIFYRLVQSKRLDHEGFYILNNMIHHLPPEKMKTHIPKVLTILFNRLQSNKTGKFVRCLILFLSLVVLRYNTVLLISSLETLKSGLFKMTLRLWLEEVHDVKGSSERKLCAISLAKMIVEFPFQKLDIKIWGNMLYQLVLFFEKKKEKSVEFVSEKEMKEFNEQIALSEAAYTGKFSQLTYAKKPEIDYTKGISDSKVFFAKKLSQLLQNNDLKSKLLPIIAHDQNVFKKIVEYFKKGRLNLNLLK